MKTIEYRSHDRSGWKPGPWDGEPDKLQWQDEATKLPCLAVRNRSGAWCGYVGVAEGHPAFGVEYHGCLQKPPCGAKYCGHSPGSLYDVHGGLAFSSFCREESKPESGICHLPEGDEPHHVWWFGFDCQHGYDSAPGTPDYFRHLFQEGDYRTLSYVKENCASLAAQLHQSLDRGMISDPAPQA